MHKIFWFLIYLTDVKLKVLIKNEFLLKQWQEFKKIFEHDGRIPEGGGGVAHPPHPVHAQLTGRALVGQGLELELGLPFYLSDKL